jgi:uncharacterized protein
MESPASTTDNNTDARKKSIRKLLRMRYFLRWLPNKGSLKRHPILGKFGNYLRNRKYLWSFKESKVGPAIFLGSVVAFLPLFGIQLPIVMALALILKVNLPVLAGLQMISNPLTFVPIYLANYKVGSWLLNAVGFEPIKETVSGTLFTGVNSTMLGGAVLGTVVGLLLYGVYMVRIKWTERISKVAL